MNEAQLIEAHREVFNNAFDAVVTERRRDPETNIHAYAFGYLISAIEKNADLLRIRTTVLGLNYGLIEPL